MRAIVEDADEPDRMAALAKLLAHPVRVRIVTAMSDGRRSSASSLTETFGDVAFRTCAYHVNELFKGGALEKVDERPNRGAMEHVYALQPDSWDELSSFIWFVSNASWPLEDEPDWHERYEG